MGSIDNYWLAEGRKPWTEGRPVAAALRRRPTSFYRYETPGASTPGGQLIAIQSHRVSTPDRRISGIIFSLFRVKTKKKLPHFSIFIFRCSLFAHFNIVKYDIKRSERVEYTLEDCSVVCSMENKKVGLKIEPRYMVGMRNNGWG